MDEQKETRLVYVKRTMMKLGTAGTARSAASETYYEVFPQDNGKVKLVLLDMNDQPSVISETVDQEELEKSYEPVPDYFKNKKPVKNEKLSKQLAKKLANGKEHLKQKEYFSAEYEFEGVIQLDGRNLEAHVGKGESLIGQGDLEGAQETLDKVSQFEELYDKTNKHIFNSYGMTLRKGGFYDKAVESYTKALRMDPGDENLFYNIGRAYFDKEALDKAILFLTKCLKLKPDHQEAAALVKKINSLQQEKS